MPPGQRITKTSEPVELLTANGTVVHNKRTSTPVHVLSDLNVSNVVVGPCPPVLSPGRLCMDHKMDFVWLGSQGKPPYLREKGGKPITLRVDNYCPYPRGLRSNRLWMWEQGLLCNGLWRRRARECLRTSSRWHCYAWHHGR